jgi:2-phospho-L-lactate guanylyltransferase (CobY/MobA/RfbA family)
VTRRFVAVLVRSGVGDEQLAAAMLEDVVDMVAAMEQVEGAIVAAPGDVELARRVRWPDMPVVLLDTDDVDVATALDAVRDVGADEAALVVADVPDLPPLLLGKLFSALTSLEVAVCPAEGGALCAVAARLPAADWLRRAGVSLDADDALEQVQAAAPPRTLHVGAGWHRVRSASDVHRLDPHLEGWEATRAWLG